MRKNLAAAALAAVAFGLAPTIACTAALAQEDPPTTPQDDAVLQALTTELERSIQNLQDREEERLYYLSYRVEDGRRFSISASYGALDPGSSTADPEAGRRRNLDVAARVGSPELDNTHKLRGEWSWGGFGGSARLPIEDDVDALRVAVWRATDRAYKNAVNQLIKVKANKAVKVEAEDKADDFSPADAHQHLGDVQADETDLKAWAAQVKRLSALFKDHPLVLNSSVGVSGGVGTYYFVDSAGARIREPRQFLRITISGSVKADDGMDIELFDSIEATTSEQLPSEDEVAASVKNLIAKLEALREAPVVEPYSGPAIIMNRASAVFFHEIFGHRIEGHRQKDEDEGQTFTKKVNQPIMPDFISIVDDPTRARYGDIILNGRYAFDEEGVPAEPVTLVEKGVLRSFLMGRSPIAGFPRSNGHGRAQSGLQPVSRQGNLIVDSSRTVPFEQLRAQLIEEVKRQGKPYGLMFQDIGGGFTFTGRFMPQAFKVIPLVVYRVYPDGRADELVRGVDLVGTPLASLENILATGDDPAVFNGYCGAESGWVPVSAVAPSFLVSLMEVEKKQKGYERPPLLPPPLHPDVEWGEGGKDAEEGQ